MKFQAGDIVDYMGVPGVVVHDQLEMIPSEYPVTVELDGTEDREFFTEDGMYDFSHTKPSLTLVRRPKKMVTKYVNLYLRSIGSVRAGYTYDDEVLARSRSTLNTYIKTVAIEVPE